MDFELIAFAIVVMVLNVLDSYTTHLGFKQYPEKDLKSEANPFMRRLMLKNRWLAEVSKQVIILAMCVFLVITNGIASIRLLALLLGLVVLNNTFIVVSRAITKRKVISPAKRLLGLLRIPDKYAYVVILLVIINLALLINKVVWG